MGHRGSRLGELLATGVIAAGPLLAHRQEGTLEPEPQEGTPQPGGKAALPPWPDGQGGEQQGRAQADSLTPSTYIPVPLALREPQLPKWVSALQGGAFLFSVFVSRPLQMGRRWETHHCTLLALGLVGPGHCLSL